VLQGIRDELIYDEAKWESVPQPKLEDVIAALLRLQPRGQTITNELIATLREML
jgi:hypothetical protein